MANTYLTRSITSTNSSWTFSAWCKRSGITSTQYLVSWGGSGTGQGIGFSSSDKLQYYSESASSNPTSSAQFRDVNGWYHVVVKNNAGTITLYVNGETLANTGGTTGSALISTTLRIGEWKTNQYRFDGSMSHIHFIDGTAYNPSTFGSTDSTTGEWKINTSPSVTYGSDGFFLFKDKHNGTNTVTDSSGNSNNYTVSNGSLTGTDDCPSDVFNTYSNLYNRCNGNLSNGNTTMAQSGSSWIMSFSNLGASSGKYYWETKYTGTYLKVGFVTDVGSVLNSSNNGYTHHADHSKGWAGYISGGNLEIRNDAAVISGYSTSDLSTSFSSGDILCLALDMTNGRFHFRKNDGSWLKSGDPVNNTGGLTIPFSDSIGNVAIPAISAYTATGYTNFGNGYFGTSAISSEGTNASGIGKFEYDVPTGYTAWSTKGLNL